MQTMIVGMLAETFVHPGAGSSTGFVDLPVAREATTDYPVIVGSSLKGALRNRAREHWPDPQPGVLHDDVKATFGEQDNAGRLVVSDARLLLLPVRSLTGHFKWATCPYLIQRWQRDRRRAGDGADDVPRTQGPENMHYLGAGDGALFLEERQFAHAGALPDGVADALKAAIADRATADRLEQQLVILHDDDFAWFARYGLAVTARNVLDDKKTSKNLWYEETIPPDSVFYALLAERQADALANVRTLFAEHPYLQVGGNETVGQGWFAINLLGPEGAQT